jgi:hypothetical protein
MIEPDLRAFLEGGLGIHIGTRTSRLEPNGARALAVKVEDDRLHLIVYLADVAARRVVPDLRANSAIAVGFARPIDERACQIKGIFVEVRPAAGDERRLVEEQVDGFRTNLEHIGIPRIGTSGWITWPAVAIRFRATTIFEQTPGPDAGTLVAARP